jgi:hypothetical protein
MFAWVFHVFYIRVRPSAFTGIDGKLLFNFPVGHMCVTVASFAAAYHWLWNHPGRMKLRMFLAFALLVICIMIGFSRLYLGVHFPSEVVAGFFIGFGCVIFSATVAQNLSRVTDARVRADLPALVILSLCVLVAVFYFGRTKRRPPADGYVLSQPSIETTQTLLARLPRETHGLSGELLVPTDVIIIGEIAPVVARLRALGWGTIRPSDFFSTEISAPVFPVFVNSAPPFTALERRIADHRLIFRAWKTKFKTPEQHPVFIASVVAEQRVTKAFGISAYHIQPDLDIVLNQLAADLQGLHVTTVSFRRRGLYQWKYPFFTHGGALLVAPI